MKNMRLKVILALSLAVAVFIGASCAEADIKITIRNNRSHNMSFAFRWDGFDMDYHSRGWFTVNAEQSRTITISEAVYALTSSGFGYYATGGGSTWRGNDSNGLSGWIHPREAFRLSTDNDGDVVQPVSGMQRVLFRRIDLTRESQEDGRATITFNP